MFNVFGLFGIVVVCALVIVTIRRHNPEHAFAVTLGCMCVAVIYLLSQITGTVLEITELAGSVQMEKIDVLLKAVGISIVGQLMSDVCKDYGQTSLSGIVSLAGRFAIVIIAMPLFKDLIALAAELVG
jgi:Stage III sporulation protein AC/AD protein family.